MSRNSPRGFDMTENIHELVAERHFRLRKVQELTGLGRSSIYELMARGEFPRPIKLTAKAVAWPESAVARWLASRGTA